jgi:hypothetical protein
MAASPIAPERGLSRQPPGDPVSLPAPIRTSGSRDEGQTVAAEPGRGGMRHVGILAAAIVAALGFLPWVNWVPGGYELPGYRSLLAQWASGTAIAAGGGIVLAILSRRILWLWRARDAEWIGAWAETHAAAAIGLAAAVAGCLYAAVARLIFHGRPLLIDEIVQVRQAQIFASGHLWLPVQPHREFFSSLHMVDAAGKVYSQFPPGGPALLALGVLAGRTWIVGPLCGAISVLAFGSFVRIAEPNRRIAVAAAALFALAPFTMFMAGSHMNHVTALTCILIGAAALVHATADPPSKTGTDSSPALRTPARTPARTRWLAFLSGLGFGSAATIRPVDALAFAAPAALWYLWRALRNPHRWPDAIAALAGVALPMSAMFYVNAHTTGAPLLFGYQVLWGPNHDLGFHPAPWGEPHTPGRGLELINLYFIRLQDYLFETPFPALLPAIGALAMTRRVRPADRYMLASCALLSALYFAYWADGNFLGPRFVYALGPALALWTVRFPSIVRDRVRAVLRATAATFVFRATVFGLAVSAVIAVAADIPIRAHEYHNNFQTERWATPEIAAQSGVHDALVFVREGWEEQLVARLWALGVSRPHVETLYRAVDVCRLDSATAALEAVAHGGPPGAPVADPYPQLAPLLADSARVQGRRLGPGANAHIEAGYVYSPHCLRRVEETAAGITPLAPLLAVGGPSDRNVYVRDLHARDSLLLAEYPGRPIYLLRPASPSPSAMPAFFPVSRDSLAAEWKAESKE